MSVDQLSLVTVPTWDELAAKRAGNLSRRFEPTQRTGGLECPRYFVPRITSGIGRSKHIETLDQRVTNFLSFWQALNAVECAVGHISAA
jgi:hypothetical protein